MAEHKSKKSNTNAWVIGIVIVVLIAFGIYYSMNQSAVAPVVKNDTPVFSGSTVDMRILDYTFLPKSLTIKAGDAVNWTNLDVADHSVVSDTDAFQSPVLAKGQSFIQVFPQAGTYEYHCSVHPTMKAKIIVQ